MIAAGLALAAIGEISGRVQIVAVVITFVLLAAVLELVRRRRLVERYALLWMIAAVALLVLAIWRDGLGTLADLVGIASPPNALFLLGLGVVFGLLLNFSVAISRLSEESKILAQEVARLDGELRRERNGGPAANGGAGREPLGSRSSSPGG